MKLREYINHLDHEAQAAYALRCQIAVSYLRLHIKYASKDPSVSLIKLLARESAGCVSLAEVLEHFGITEEMLDKQHCSDRKKATHGPPSSS
jgi:hypothetical protein